MRLSSRFRVIALLIFVSLVSYWAYGHFFSAPAGAGMGGELQQVSVAEVIEREVLQWHEFSGRLAAVDSAQIRPRVAGTIEKIHFKDGEWVEKGQPLFTIDQRPYAAALQAAQARATLAEAEIKRARSLMEDKALPQREFDQRKNEVEIARAELVRARLDYDYSMIKSPIAGRVGRAEITVGNLVDAGGNAPVLTTVVADKPIYGDFDIDEQTFLRYVHAVGSDTEKLKSVQVQLGLANEEGAPHIGHVQSFDNQLNTASGTIRVRTIFDNTDGALVPGLFARVRIGDAAQQKAVLVSDRAVGTDQNRKFVLVVHDDNTTERREVKLDGIADGLRIVESGLKPGEKIIVNGIQRVMMPGQPVAPEMVNMDGSQVPGAGEQVSDEEKKQDAPKE